jgi:hypothetical protein
VRGREVTSGDVELPDHVRRVEPRDCGLLVRSRRVRRPAPRLDLVERANPLSACERERRFGFELSRTFQQERLHRPQPRRLRDGKRLRAAGSETPDPRTRIPRLKRRRGRDRSEAPVSGAKGNDAVGCCQSDARPLSTVGRASVQVRTCVGVVAVEGRDQCRVGREVVNQCAIGGLDHRTIDGRTRGRADRRAVRLVASLDGDNRVIDSGSRVAHVDLAFALEGSRSDDRVLGDLVPLLNGVRKRRKHGVRSETRRAADHY